MKNFNAENLARFLARDWQFCRVLKTVHGTAPSFVRDDGGFKMSEFNNFLAKQGLINISDKTSQKDEDDFQAAREAGFEFKEWETEIDGRQRVEHDARNGERIPIDERFSIQFPNSIGPMYPRDKNATDEDICNCRCDLVYF
jgi:hypothetical protein